VEKEQAGAKKEVFARGASFQERKDLAALF